MKAWSGAGGAPKRLVKYVPKKDWQRLIEKAGEGRDNCGQVYRALVALALYTGIRLNEALQLNPEDVDLTEKGERVTILRGKGDRQRTSDIPAEAARHIRRYVDGERREKLERSQEKKALFISDHGQRLCARQVQRVMNDLGERMGMPWLTYHKLRHSHATELLRKTRNLELVRRQLGHSDIRTTTIYTHVADEERGEAVRKL